MVGVHPWDSLSHCFSNLPCHPEPGFSFLTALSALGQLWAWFANSTEARQQAVHSSPSPWQVPLGPSLLPSVNFLPTQYVLVKLEEKNNKRPNPQFLHCGFGHLFSFVYSFCLSADLSIMLTRPELNTESQNCSCWTKGLPFSVCARVWMFVCICMGVFIQKCGRGRKKWIGMRNSFFFPAGKEPEITSVQKYPASLTDKYSDMGRRATE